MTRHIPTECMKCGSKIVIMETDWSTSSAYCYPCAATKFYSGEGIDYEQEQTQQSSAGQGEDQTSASAQGRIPSVL